MGNHVQVRQLWLVSHSPSINANPIAAYDVTQMQDSLVVGNHLQSVEICAHEPNTVELNDKGSIVQANWLVEILVL